jgi:hypothetical protein
MRRIAIVCGFVMSGLTLLPGVGLVLTGIYGAAGGFGGSEIDRFAMLLMMGGLGTVLSLLGGFCLAGTVRGIQRSHFRGVAGASGLTVGLVLCGVGNTFAAAGSDGGGDVPLLPILVGAAVFLALAGLTWWSATVAHIAPQPAAQVAPAPAVHIPPEPTTYDPPEPTVRLPPGEWRIRPPGPGSI